MKNASPSADMLHRQPRNRRLWSDALGFILSLVLVLGILSQSAHVMPVALAMGLNPMLWRAVGVFAAGIICTLFMSEVIIGKADPRRHLFVLGMLGFFLAGAMWFALCLFC